MKIWAQNSLPIVLAVIFLCSLFAGCDNKGSRPTNSEKMSRLIAEENAQLIKKLKDQQISCQKQLANQGILNDKQVQRLKNTLDKCQKENQSLHEISDKGMQEYMSNIVGPLADENTRLKKENEVLKAQIEELKKQ